MVSLRCLRLITAFPCSVASPTTGREASAAVSLEAAAALARTTTAGATATSSKVGVSAVGIGASTTLLDVDLFRANLVRVSRDSGSVASGLRKLDKSAVLN